MNAGASLGNDASPTVTAVYCYAIHYQPTDEWIYATRWPKLVKIANVPALLGGTGDTIVFRPGQISHEQVEQTMGFEAKSVNIAAKVRGDVLQRFFVTPSTVRVKMFILRISTINLLNDGATLNFDTDVQISESGLVSQIGMQGQQLECALVPEPFANSQSVPRIAYGRSCQRVFGRCGVDLEAIKTVTTIFAADRAQRIITAAVAMPSANYWRSGNFAHAGTGTRLFIEWADNAGTGGRARLRISAWCKEFAAGDAVTIYPGCALTTDNCRVHGNIANFGGFAYVPTDNPSLHGGN